MVIASLIAVGKAQGTTSTLFGVMFIFACIVIYDAMGVRHAAGQHAKAINKLNDIILKNPTKTGYIFTGWDKSFNNVTSNLTITAKYEEESNNPQLKVSKVTARAGEEIQVTVSIKNNPGIGGCVLQVGFDNTKLTLTGATAQVGVSQGFTYTPPKNWNNSNPTTFLWDAMDPNWTEDGLVITLNFTVNSTTPIGVYDITLTSDVQDDIDYNDVEFEIFNGAIEVIA